MKAPEIIFLPIVNLGVEDGECTAPIWWNKDKTAEHSDVVKAIYYIRKDLLLEWAEGKKKHYMDRQEYDCGWNDLLDELIEKLNSL